MHPPTTFLRTLMNATRTGRLAVVSITLLAAGPASPQSGPPAPPAARPPACAGAEHRQFDFWLGRWEVTNPAGQVVGTNEIESVLDGCVVRETWTGASGSVGSSFNIYDRQTRQWHQTWVDNGGLLLRLSGGLEQGAMILSGHLPGEQGGQVLHRITWTPLGDGRVRQHWRASGDEGRTWRTVFDGLYRRVEGGREIEAGPRDPRAPAGPTRAGRGGAPPGEQTSRR